MPVIKKGVLLIIKSCLAACYVALIGMNLDFEHILELQTCLFGCVHTIGCHQNGYNNLYDG